MISPNQTMTPLTCISQICNPSWGITHRMMGENNPDWSEVLREKKKGDMFLADRPDTFARYSCEDFFSEDVEGEICPDTPFLEELEETDIKDDLDCLPDEEYIRAWEALLLERQIPRIKPKREIFVAQKPVPSCRRHEKMYADWKGEFRRPHARGRKRAPGISDRVRAHRKAVS